MAQSATVRVKWANITGQGLGPILGFWKLLHFQVIIYVGTWQNMYISILIFWKWNIPTICSQGGKKLSGFQCSNICAFPYILETLFLSFLTFTSTSKMDKVVPSSWISEIFLCYYKFANSSLNLTKNDVLLKMWHCCWKYMWSNVVWLLTHCSSLRPHAMS